MARSKRNIAGFNDVANRNNKDSDNPKININVNDDNNENKNTNENKIANENTNKNTNKSVSKNANENKNENIDPLDKVLMENKKKDKTHILKGIYFEREVAAAIDRIGKNGGKGIKSQIVNEAVKKVFKEKGWM